MRSPSCSNAMHQGRGGAMSENLRQRLLDAGYTWDEAEDRLADIASDEYDDEQDRRAEEHFANKERKDV